MPEARLASAPWEENAHAHDSRPQGIGCEVPRCMTARRSVLGRRETSGPLEMLHGALFSVGRPRRESGVRIREHTRCGCTQFDWVADVGWTHRASSSPGGRKTCWGTRALAGRKSAAPPDAGRGWVEGETVRVCEASNKLLHARPAGLGLQALDTTEGVPGLLPVLLSPAGRRRVLWLAGQLLHGIRTARSRVDAGQRIGRNTDSDSGVPESDEGTSEVDTVR